MSDVDILKIALMLLLTLIRTRGGLARPPAKYKLVTQNVLGTGAYDFMNFLPYAWDANCSRETDRLTTRTPLFVGDDARLPSMRVCDTLCSLLLQHYAS